MSNNTLLLNADAQPMSLVPLSAIDWQSAIRYVWLNKARVLHEYEDWAVHSPSQTMQVPAVIMLNEFMRPKSRVRFGRKWVFLRDNYTCQYCAKELAPSQCTIDHVMPVSKGGKTTWHNVVTACTDCNNSKGNNHKIRPKIEPEQPNYWLLASNRKKKDWNFPHPSWLNYIDNGRI
jgi:5-methylcytosine-specific restriction endonuclease McrA